MILTKGKIKNFSIDTHHKNEQGIKISTPNRVLHKASRETSNKLSEFMTEHKSKANKSIHSYNTRSFVGSPVKAVILSD
jgi:hypothetical protein